MYLYVPLWCGKPVSPVWIRWLVTRVDRNRAHGEAAYHRDGAHGYRGYRKGSRE
jgi:hypothetical protein